MQKLLLAAVAAVAMLAAPAAQAATVFNLTFTGLTSVSGSPSRWTDRHRHNHRRHQRNFFTGTFDISPAGVPEPSTWAMLILGFGGIGVMLRGTRRRQAALNAARASGPVGPSIALWRWLESSRPGSRPGRPHDPPPLIGINLRLLRTR